MKNFVKVISILFVFAISVPCDARDFMVGSWVTESILDGENELEGAYSGIVFVFSSDGKFEFKYQKSSSPHKGKWEADAAGNVKIVVYDTETSMVLMESSMFSPKAISKDRVEFKNELNHKVRLKRIR